MPDKSMGGGNSNSGYGSGSKSSSKSSSKGSSKSANSGSKFAGSSGTSYKSGYGKSNINHSGPNTQSGPNKGSGPNVQLKAAWNGGKSSYKPGVNFSSADYIKGGYGRYQQPPGSGTRNMTNINKSYPSQGVKLLSSSDQMVYKTPGVKSGLSDYMSLRSAIAPYAGQQPRMQPGMQYSPGSLAYNAIKNTPKTNERLPTASNQSQYMASNYGAYRSPPGQAPHPTQMAGMPQSPMAGQGAPGFSNSQTYGNGRDGEKINSAYNRFAVNHTAPPEGAMPTGSSPSYVDSGKSPGDYSYPRKAGPMASTIAKVGGGIIGGITGGIGGIFGGAGMGNSMVNGYNKMINMPYSSNGGQQLEPAYGLGSDGGGSITQTERKGLQQPVAPVPGNSAVQQPGILPPQQQQHPSLLYPEYYSSWWGGLPSGRYG